MASENIRYLAPEEYNIRKARHRDIPHLASIELSAAEIFSMIPALAWIADSNGTLSLSKLTKAYRAGTLWVATDDSLPVNYDVPVAFLCATEVDGCLYIEELSTMSKHQKKGLGKFLLQAAEEYTLSHELTRVTLITDKEVPWGCNFYSKIGFKQTSAEFIGPGHLAIAEGEEHAGFDLSRRCVMVKKLSLGYVENVD